MTTADLSNAALLGLSKHFADLAKDARKEIEPGAYAVDSQIVVDIKGSVRVGEDETYQPTTEIPLKTTLALFVKYSGITGDAALNALEKAMSEAARLDKKAAESLQEMASLAEAEERVRKTLKKLPKKTRAGKVTSVTITDIKVLR